MKFLSFLFVFLIVSCSENTETSSNKKNNGVSNTICNCYKNSHHEKGIDYLKEVTFYKKFIKELSKSSADNLSIHIISIYDGMQEGTFEARLYDTTLQKEFNNHLNFKAVKNCIIPHEKELGELIEVLDRIGMSESFSDEEQIKILKSLEEGLKDSENATWVEPFQINAFFYIYDRYNKAASEVKIDVLYDEFIPPPPPPPSMPTIPPPDDYEIEESIEEVPMDEIEYDF